MKIQQIFTPYAIGNCEIPNRLVVPAMVANMCPDGAVYPLSRRESQGRMGINYNRRLPG